MRQSLENIKALLIELIGLVGGIIWAKNTNWDYEPLILVAISTIGIILFILLRYFRIQEDRPIVEFAFIIKYSQRSPPCIIPNISPMDKSGKYFIHEVGGFYHFEIKKKYDLIIRNNSKNNAYDLAIYMLKNNYPLSFEEKYNSLDPLIIDKPKSIPFSYIVNRPMTHHDSKVLMDTDFPEDIKRIVLIAEYKSESRKKFYTKFSTLNSNEHLKKFNDLKNFERL